MFSSEKLAKEVISIRIKQLIINELNKKNRFKIPIHLALGHESIAVSVMSNLKTNDNIILSHRNIHYNLFCIKNFRKIVDEFALKKSGLAKGNYGSMNLFNTKKKIIYTSSILGNNFSVAAGSALSLNIENKNNYTFIITGDGAIEEGAFYEALLLISSLNLRVIIIVENNGWSLASTINQRRVPISLNKITKSLGGEYYKFCGNNFFEYYRQLQNIKKNNFNLKKPIVVEVILQTLGGYNVTENYKSRYINYHAGVAAKIDIKDGPLINNNFNDPVYFAKKILSLENNELKSKLINNMVKYL